MNKEHKLNKLYEQCIEELQSIGIFIQNNNDIGSIQIRISRRNNKRYGACKQEEPEQTTMYLERIGRRKVIKYQKYRKHTIEISPWVMELDDSIIKNTIMHEIIHCLPECNNHGKVFKQYAKYINQNLGYDIARVRKQRKRL